METHESENKDRAAFPSTDGKTFANDGLTKREYFASMAMQGLLSGRTEFEDPMIDARKAVELADELIKALETKQ